MEAPGFRAPRRKTQRRWRVPPALRRGDESFEGLAILEEVGGPAGLLLWQSLRDALLWADVAPDERPHLFTPGAEQTRVELIEAAAPSPGVEGPLREMARLLSAAAGASAGELAAACAAVSAWAGAAAHPATALAFAQAAATLTPRDASAAFGVGSLALGCREQARAETWFRRAVALARQAGDWRTYAAAFLEMGRLNRARGNLPAGRRLLQRAVRAARRNGLREVEGMGMHELFVLAIQGGPEDEARALARGAFDAYGPGHPALPRLAQDLARWWMALGHFARAGNVLRAVLPHVSAPRARLAVHAGLARAAGGVGDHEGFRAGWDRVFALLDDAGAREHAAEPLLQVAHGAASLGLWDRAEKAAREAVEVGGRRVEARVRTAAEALVESVRRHRTAETRTEALQPPASTAADARLATELIRSLKEAPADRSAGALSRPPPRA